MGEQERQMRRRFVQALFPGPVNLFKLQVATRSQRRKERSLIGLLGSPYLLLPLLLSLSIFPPFFLLSRCRFDGFLASDIIAIFWRRHPIQRMLPLPLPLFAPFLQGDSSAC